MKRARWSLAILAFAGCATSGLRAEFVPDEVLKYDRAKYPDDAAVVLFREDKMRLDTEGEWVSHQLRHEVTAIQSEGGFGLAQVSVTYGARQRLADFRARVVQPDGAVRELDARDMLFDGAGKGDHDANAHFFRFPDVRVGSVLEYAWVIETPWIINHDDQDTLGVFPVGRYEFELIASKPLVLEAIELNSTSPIEVRTRASGAHELAFQLENLPPRVTETYAPHWTFTEPRWAWRVVAYKPNAITTDWLRDWKDVVERRGEQFFVESDLYDGFDARVDFAGCEEVSCKVQRAQEFVRSKTTSNVSWNRQQELAKALSSGRASITERALMLRKLLEDGGVEAWLAYGTDKAGRQRTPTFPSLAQFDHLFVYLPVQAGLSSPMTIDPHCEFCAPGTLTDRHRGAPIYVFRTRKVLGGVDTEGRWTTAWAEPESPPNGELVTHTAVVGPDGTVTDRVVFSDTGLRAMNRAANPPSPSKVVPEAEDAALEVSRLATVTDVSFGPCDRKAGKCSWAATRTLPVMAVQDGTRWYVSTALLQPVFETLFDEELRKQDLHFDGSGLAYEEVLDLEAPAGFKLVPPERPLEAECEAMKVTLAVVPTPRGAKLTRTLLLRLGEWPKAMYPDVRRTLDVFKQARHQLLVFQKQ